MPAQDSITVLHVSDMQFGRNHRFGNLAAGDPDAELDTLFTRLDDDLKLLAKEHGLRPQLVVASGDLAEWGRKKELEDAFEFLDRLAASLGLPRDKVVVVPGNHDVNRKRCESYFLECESEEEKPVAPYVPKWESYRQRFSDFYAGVDGVDFTVDRPWGLWVFDDLRLVVAGLNSTIRESHREEDHYGWVGERQLRWFSDALEPYVEREWLRIGVVHHNVRRGAVDDDENLRDADDLKARLGSALNVLLHGHTHEGKTDSLHPRLPVLSTGSAALDASARADDVPNQYQLIRLHADRVERWTRRYTARAKRWEGDTGSSVKGDRWHVVDEFAFERVAATFEVAASRSPLDSDPEERRSERATERSFGRHDFLARVAEVCELRHGGEGRRVKVETIRDDPRHEYLSVYVADDAHVRPFPIGLSEPGITGERVQEFCDAVFEPRYWALDRSARCEIVYGGERADDELIEWAAGCNVVLRSFVELQGIVDFRAYVERQTARLQSDVIYPPGLYVPQRLQYDAGVERVEVDDALAKITGWLREPRAQFVLVLGDFGAGKTFLLHELARRMPDDIPHLVPMLVELRSLEKANTLEQLVAQHLAINGERYIDLDAFPYMLREGRIALLFDGFDELAQRVTYQRAAEHFESLVQAAGGEAKVVVTSRTQHFESDRQVKLALLDRAERVPNLSLCRLQPFDDAQILAFLIRRLGDEAEARERFELIQDVEDLLGLSHNPRMLGFIAALGAKQLREARERAGTITSAELYRLLIDQWMEYEAVKIAPRGVAPTLTKDERLQAVTAIALRLWSKLERTIHLSELGAEVSGMAASLSDVHGSDGPDRDNVTHLVGSRTLLVRDEEGAFAFVHQSVMEWLVAAHAAQQLAAGYDPDALGARAMTRLMTDFLCDLADPALLRQWARATTQAAGGAHAGANALLVLDRLGEQVSGASLAGQELAGRDLTQRDLVGADLMGADLTDARLAGADLRDADLRGATLVRAELDGAVLKGALLDRADARGASLLSADLRGAGFDGASLRFARLTGAHVLADALVGCDTFGAALPAMVRPEAMPGSAASPCASVAIHPAGDLVAAGHADGAVRLWDPATGRHLRTLTGHQGGVRAVAFAFDGATLASAGDDGSLRLWDPATGRELRTLTGHQSGVRAVAFAPDGATLASAGNDGSVRLWDPATGRELRTLTGHQGWVAAVAFAPDGATLASASDDGYVRLWDPATGRKLRTLTGHEGGVGAVAFAPDGATLASAGDDGSVRLWDPATGRELPSLTGHQSGVRAVAFAPDGATLASAGSDGGVRLWDPATGRELRSLTGHQGWVRAVAFASDGATLASAGSDGGVRLWDPAIGRELRSLTGHQDWVRAVAFAPDGATLASAGRDGRVRLWDPANGRELRTLTGHEGWVGAVAFAPDGATLASAGRDGRVRLWDPANGRELRTVTGHQGGVVAIAFAPDDATLASAGDDGSVRLWDTATGRQLRTLTGHQDWVRAVAFAPDGATLASAGDDGSVRLWDPATGRELRTFTGDQGGVRAVAFAPDGATLASAGSDGSVRLWDPATGRELRTFTGDQGGVRAVAFAPDGATLASAGDDGSVRLWDTANGRELRSLTAHEGGVRAVAFAPDGATLASAGSDGGVRLWTRVGALLATLVGTDDGSIAYVPDGRYKLDGQVAPDRFWYAIGLCRFAPGELDAHLPAGTLTRVALDEPLWER